MRLPFATKTAMTHQGMSESMLWYLAQRCEQYYKSQCGDSMELVCLCKFPWMFD